MNQHGWTKLPGHNEKMKIGSSGYHPHGNNDFRIKKVVFFNPIDISLFSSDRVMLATKKHVYPDQATLTLIDLLTYHRHDHSVRRIESKEIKTDKVDRIAATPITGIVDIITFPIQFLVGFITGEWNPK